MLNNRDFSSIDPAFLHNFELSKLTRFKSVIMVANLLIELQH